MKALELNQMEEIEGGGWYSWAVGAACAGLIVGGIAGGPAGVAALAVLGPSTCIAGGITAAALD